MTTLEMKCILMLAETLNFSKAAQEMNITQPAFSRMILRAEEELGFKLFLRNTRSVEISREGENFIVALRQSFAIYKAGIESARNMLREDKSLIVACASEFVCLELAPHIVQFKKKHPDIFVECVPMATENIPDRLRTRQFDIGFIFADRDHFNSDFASHTLKQIPLHLVINQDNPLSQKEIIMPRDLEKENLIVLRRNVGAYEIGTYGAPLLILNRSFGLHLKESAMAETTQESMIRVACNQGVCFLTSTLGYLVPQNCVMRRIDGVDFNFTALWNRGSLSRWAQLFLTEVSEKIG